MANKHVQVFHEDELRFDTLIPEEHFGRGYLVTNRVMGTLPFVVGDKVVVGDAEVGLITAILTAPMDDRWEVFYQVIAEVEAAAVAPPAEAGAVPARRRRKPKAVPAAVAPPALAEGEADAQRAKEMLAMMEAGQGGAGGAGDSG